MKASKLNPLAMRAKTGKKNIQLLLRINSAERDAFVSLCEELDTSAAREIRQFIRVIRGFLSEHYEGRTER